MATQYISTHTNIYTDVHDAHIVWWISTALLYHVDVWYDDSAQVVTIWKQIQMQNQIFIYQVHLLRWFATHKNLGCHSTNIAINLVHWIKYGPWNDPHKMELNCIYHHENIVKHKRANHFIFQVSFKTYQVSYILTLNINNNMLVSIILIDHLNRGDPLWLQTVHKDIP